MSKPTRSIDERIQEKEEQLRIATELVEQRKAQLRELKERKNIDDRKRRNHLLIVAGAELAHIFEHTLDEDEIKQIGQFIKAQVDNGSFTLGSCSAAAQRESDPVSDFDVFFNGFGNSEG